MLYSYLNSVKVGYDETEHSLNAQGNFISTFIAFCIIRFQKHRFIAPRSFSRCTDFTRQHT